MIGCARAIVFAVGTGSGSLDLFIEGSYPGDVEQCVVASYWEKEVPMHGGFLIALIGAIAGLITAIAALKKR